MNKIKVKLAILFDGTFWIGIFERNYNGKLEVAKYTFGSEPKSNEIYYLILYKFDKLKYSNSLKIKKIEKKKINPKRLKRIAQKQIENVNCTKSQQIIKEQLEKNKIIKKSNNKIKKEEIEKRKFLQKQKKKIEKHKGR